MIGYAFCFNQEEHWVGKKFTKTLLLSLRNATLSVSCAMKGFLFVFNSKEYKKSENVVVCISNSKSLTARFAKAYAKIAKENFNKNS